MPHTAPFLLGLGLCCLVAAPAQTVRPLFALDLEREYMPHEANFGDKAVAGDVDGDGDADLLVHRYDTTRLFLNDGRGRFASPPQVVAQTYNSSSLKVMKLFDVDRDGDLDLFRALGNPVLEVWLNDGTGRFTLGPNRITGLGLLDLRNLAFHDLDGDGYQDLVMVALGARRILVAWNDGKGFFAYNPNRQLPYLTNWVQALSCGDVDGDGDIDLAVGISGGNNALLLGDGKGGFTDVAGTNIVFTNEWTADLELVDVDGDRDLDLVCANRGRQARLYRNDGKGRFTDATSGTMPSSPLPDDNLLFLRRADIDRDGDPDFFVGSESDGKDLLYRNDGTGRYADITGSHFSTGSWKTIALLVQDLDFDGDPDLLAIYNDHPTRQFLNDGKGKLVDTTPGRIPNTWGMPQVADLTGDNRLDLVLEGLLIGDGTGWFHTADPRTHSPPGNAAAVGDLDGDGDLDLVERPSTGSLIIHLNDGKGRFTPAKGKPVPAINYSILSVTLGDVDGDRDLDMLVGTINTFARPAPDVLLLNDGTGNFSDVSSTHLPRVSNWTETALMVDLDADGDLDLVLANILTTQARVYQNRGKGVFIDVTSTHMPGTATTIGWLRTGDVDGDGDPDLLAGSFTRSPLLLLNDGMGVFHEDKRGSFPAGDHGHAGVLFDHDLDGDLDAMLALIGSSTATLRTALFRNDGKGRFQEIPGGVPNLEFLPNRLHAADLDGDGDPDVVCGLSGHSRGPTCFLFNLTRQLHTPLFPRLGHPYPVDVYGDPTRQTAIPLLGFTETTTPLSPHGTLHIGAPGLVVLPPVFLKPEGKGTFHLTVPRDPVLVGAPFLLQGFLADHRNPRRSGFTNLVRERVTGL